MFTHDPRRLILSAVLLAVAAASIAYQALVAPPGPARSMFFTALYGGLIGGAGALGLFFMVLWVRRRRAARERRDLRQTPGGPP